MTRTSTLIIVTALLTVGWGAELFAQTPNITDSSTRRASLLTASRVNMFGSSGGLNDERAGLKSESLADSAGDANRGGSDRFKTMLERNDLATILDDPTVSNMNAFLTYTGALQRALGLDSTTTIPADAVVGGLLMGSVDTTDVTLSQAPTTTGRRLYPPRLRFWPNPEDLEELQKPEVVAQWEETDHKRTMELVADINDKFGLPPSANIALEFDGLTALIQGRVPNPTVCKQIEMYLSFEPGVYSVQNNLEIDPEAGAVELPTTHNDPAL
jgi:hypothetical protein